MHVGGHTLLCVYYTTVGGKESFERGATILMLCVVNFDIPPPFYIINFEFEYDEQLHMIIMYSIAAIGAFKKFVIGKMKIIFGKSDLI